MPIAEVAELSGLTGLSLRRFQYMYTVFFFITAPLIEAPSI